MKMRPIIIAIIVLLTFSTVSLAKSRVIDRPEITNRSTDQLDFSKIEMTDSETILYCDAYNRPGNWILLASGSYLKGQSGIIYKLIRSEGFELDKRVNMPESGHVSFTLHFAPLSNKEKSFDFLEGEADGNFKLTGIKTFKAKSHASIRCLIKGEVLDRPQSSRLILTKEGGDSLVSAIYIPIRDGKFEYVLNCNDIESYELIFYDERLNGVWRLVTFFAEPGTVSFKLFPMGRFYENVVEGGAVNREYLQ